ncbi:MAG: acyloxyacyl hydrolase [Phycisphaerales bacterium]
MLMPFDRWRVGMVAAAAALVMPAVASANEEPPAAASMDASQPATTAPSASNPSSASTASGASAVSAAVSEPLFLDKGWRALSFGGGVAFASDSTDSSAVVTFHQFIARDFEFNLSLAGWFYAQDEDDDDGEEAQDALGVNPAFGFRWHFLSSATTEAPSDRSWSVYADIGIGVVFTDEDVPPGGTKYNFTPRAGVGATFALGESGTRLDVGLRWAHVSNASTSGTDDNPSRDSVMGYVGVMFPF